MWNNSLGCTIFHKYHISILQAKRIVKMKDANTSGVIDVLRL